MTDEKQTQEQADEEMINQGFQELLDSYLATKHRKKVEIITKAFNFAKQAHKGVKRRSGEPYIMHPIAVAKIVCTEIGLGSTSICSALLHDVVEDTDYTVEDIENLFGPKIAQIVDGLTKISGGIFGDRASAQAENFKKLVMTGIFVGMPIIYIGGCISMYAVNRISVWATLMTAVIPFLFGDVVKVVIAAMMAVKISKFRVGA